ncbi:nuclear transport factor 2 family protein [Hyunsoonleella aquatilis]|uniref:nuclear transport factor 2 family protein n=1 Tax=Hyunsoonleella aquatilis TaxID=2762758 RepID=UPI001FED0900|nr:nuclear transport factor 2 family protein [Hyunsoonleella aquatilis]
MKYFYLLFLAFWFFLGCDEINKKIDNTQDFKAVEQLVQGVFDDVWSNQDETQISKYHTEDFVLLEHGEVWTNDSIVNWCQRYQQNDPGFTRINTFDFLKSKREGNRIWMAYHNYATLKKDTLILKVQWLESLVAVKQDSIWKLEMLHSTRLPGEY